MGLLGEVDQPGSVIEAYASRLDELLTVKAESLAALRRKLRSFRGLLAAKHTAGM